VAEDRERSAPAPVQDQEEAAAGEAAGRRAPDGDREGAWEKLEDGSKFLELSMGPQHPSTHGVLRLAVRLDGEEVVDCKVDIGYLHRSFEKFAETWQYPQLAPFVDRNDYLAGTLNEHAYCLAVERLLGLEVPERAEYIRVIMAELNRIGSHLIWFGTFAMDLGATTAFLWAFAARERLYDLNEVVTGGRMFPQFFRLGGVRNDFPPAFFPMVEKTLDELERSLAEYHGLISGNPIFLARTKGIGRLSAEDALAYGCSGPMLRGSGIPYDVRKADPYTIYGRFQFDVPVGQHGDVGSSLREVSMWITWGGQARAQAWQPTHLSSLVSRSTVSTGTPRKPWADCQRSSGYWTVMGGSNRCLSVRPIPWIRPKPPLRMPLMWLATSSRRSLAASWRPVTIGQLPPGICLQEV